MDNGIWATWYDLGDGDRSDYFGWLNEEYLPSLRARPGYAWAARYKGGGKEGKGMGDVRSRLGRMDDPTGHRAAHHPAHRRHGQQQAVAVDRDADAIAQLGRPGDERGGHRPPSAPPSDGRTGLRGRGV